MTKLHEIAAEYREVAALADSDDEGMAQAVLDTLEAVGGEFEQKAQTLVRITLNRDSDIAALEAEIKRLEDRKRVIVNQQQSFKDYLRRNMEATGITKISCPLFSITLAKGRESVVVDDENSIPDDLMRVKTEIAPDKTAIAAKLKAGEEVPGARLERGQSSIRIK